MGRKRKVAIESETTTAILEPENVSVATANKIVEDKLVVERYDAGGNAVQDANLSVAERINGQYYVMFIDSELYNPKVHKLNKAQQLSKMRRVPQSCYNSYMEFLKTGSEARYKNADSQAFLTMS